MAMKAWSSATPKSWTRAMFGCSIAAAIWYSRRKRSKLRTPAPSSGGWCRTLSATLRAGPLALGEVDARDRAFGELAHVAEAADRGVAEARRARATRRRAPRAARTGRAAPAPRAAPRSATPWSTFLRDRQACAPGMDRGLLRLRRRPRQQVDDRRKAVAAAQVAQPVDAELAPDLVAEQHGVVGAAREIRRQAAARGRLVLGDRRRFEAGDGCGVPAGAGSRSGRR